MVKAVWFVGVPILDSPSHLTHGEHLHLRLNTTADSFKAQSLSAGIILDYTG